VVELPVKCVALTDAQMPLGQVRITWAWAEQIGSCSRVWPPYKSSLSVKILAAATASSVHGPSVFETPRLAFKKNQRLLPMLTRRVSSYCPQGTDTCRAAPTIRSCL